MTEILRVTLLGSPRVQLGEHPLSNFATNKAQALLFYLVVTGQPHSRDTVATLLWGDMTDAQAKKNLRSVLPNLRRLVGNYLYIDRQTIAFDHTCSYWLDVEDLRRALTPDLTPGHSPMDLAARQRAIDLYQGEFLSGFYVRNASVFDAWVLQQREHLHALVVQALFALVDEQAQRAEYAAALAANRRLLELEPWSEPAHRQQMLMLAQTGERAAALAQYAACQRVLAAEFGVSPLAETTALYDQIRAGEIGEQGQEQKARTEAPWPDKPGGVGFQAHDSARARTPSPVKSQLPVAGHALPQQTKLYGRQWELDRLRTWVVAEGCRLVGILGIGGQGKSALAAALVRDVAEAAPGMGGRGGFTRVIWHSLVNAPPLADVMQEWIYLLSDQTVTSSSMSLDQQFGRLLDDLHHQRCLLILDNLESVLQSGGRSGYYRPGYEEYGQLIRHLAEGDHRSCLLFTSREHPQELIHLEEDTPAVHFLSLPGLPADAGGQMLQSRGLVDDPTGLNALVEQYSGNPLALKLVAETVQDIFQSNVAAFLQAETLIFDDIRDVLDQQFARLAPLEREIIVWLAIVREPLPYLDLRRLLAQPPAARSILEAVRSLQRRSLLERYDEVFGLQNVVLEYITEWLVDTMCHSIQRGVAQTSHGATPGTTTEPRTTKEAIARSVLNCYALILAQTKEYVRASQHRLLLQPVAARVVAHLGARGTQQHLLLQLAHLRRTLPIPGYAAANLLHLLLNIENEYIENEYIEAEPSAYDLSGLHVRQLYLRGVSLPRANFARAEIVDSVFTDPFGLIYATTFSPGGKYLAAGTSEGDIYLWHTTDQQLVQVIQGHHQSVRDLSFAEHVTPDGAPGLVLASASDDQSVGLWLLTRHGQIDWQARLSHEQQKLVISVHVGPAGKRVTSVDSRGHVFVWEVNAGAHAQLAHHFETTPTRIGLVAYSGDGRTVAVGNRDGTVQLHQITTGELILELTSETGAIAELGLSEDGRLLATGGLGGHLCLWSVPEKQILDVVETKKAVVDALAFSPDGKMLVSAHNTDNHPIRVWRIDKQHRLRLHLTLFGHTQNIWSAAFGPVPAANTAPDVAAARQLLVTGSTDQTVRVWDVKTGQLLYTQRGQPRALSAFAIHPVSPTAPSSVNAATAEWLVAAVGYDRLVHLWSGQGVQVDKKVHTLAGSSKALYMVAISPGGRIVAAAGHDRIVYLWDVAGGQLLQKLHGHTGAIECMAFHSDDLLITSSMNGEVCFWNLSKFKNLHAGALGRFQPSQPTAVHQVHPRRVQEIAVSPNGDRLATVGGDCSLRLWDMTQRHYPELMRERRTIEAAGEREIFSVAFSPDAQKIACGGSSLIHLWNLHDDESPLILRQHAAEIFSVAFSPDGTMLASGSLDCTVCVWDVDSGTLRTILHGHTEIVYQVAFSPDGSAVLSCSADGTIRFWDVQTGECVNIVRVSGPYAGMNIAGVTGVTEAQKAALKALGAVEE